MNKKTKISKDSGKEGKNDEIDRVDCYKLDKKIVNNHKKRKGY